MTTAELIKLLKEMPQDAEVGYAWDGGVYGSVRFVWLARSGTVVLADGNVIYDTEDRPASAPRAKENKYWEPE